VEVGFTAEMEEILDDISNGERDWLDFIRAFFRGDGKHPGLENLVNQKAGVIDYPFLDLGPGTDGAPVQVRIGRFGPYVSWGEHKASIPADVAPADLNLDRAMQIVQAKAEGPRTLGEDPKTGEKIYVMLGRFGPYVQLGETPTDKKAEKPRRASLGRNYTEDGITLEDALKLLSLPRELGQADDGEVIVANIGRFGPYIKKGDDFRSLTPEDDVYTVTLERAKELLAQEKKSARRQRAAAKELKALGPHPDSGAQVRVLDGRYGPYVTDGETNASLPKGASAEALTMEEAKALLEARAGAPKSARRTRAAKKSAAPKRAAKKSKRAAAGA
jgi:DNA topoisomerase-1